MSTVLYPGSFDPVHNGHVEIIGTASRLFDTVVVAVMLNPGKVHPLFTDDERADMIKEAVVHLPNVEVTMFGGLVVDIATELKIDLIVKGLRGVSDFEGELQMAQMNRSVTGIETLFIPSTSEDSFIASKYIREISKFGGKVSHLVPEGVARRLAERH
ncbi:MAG: pantetheine-phosphate adenylyltransferase [Candidatus Poriferisodalaceae bacterium]|jgi:pantetheine-phosphate adenylyltransferase